MFRYRKQSAIVLATPKNLYGHTLDGMGLDALGEQAIREAHQPNRGAISLRGPILLADGNPHLPWKLIGELMEREGRDEADHTLGHAFRCLCETVVASSGASGS